MYGDHPVIRIMDETVVSMCQITDRRRDLTLLSVPEYDGPHHLFALQTMLLKQWFADRFMTLFI